MSSYCNSNSNRIIIAEVAVITAVIITITIGILAVHVVARIVTIIILLS